jgi:hypothetical protein
VIDLNFLAKDVGSTGATRSYALNQTMRLPEDFGDDLSMALAAVAVSAVAPATNAGKYFVPALVPVMERLNYLVENPPHSLRGESKAQVFHASALACQTLGE